MEDYILKNDLYTECLDICQKIEAFTCDKSIQESEKELTALKEMWQSALRKVKVDDKFSDVEKRYKNAIAKAEAFFEKSENNIDSNSQGITKIIQLEQIIKKIEDMVNGAELPNAENQFHQLINDWETSIVHFKDFDESLQKRYWEACEKYKKNKEWILWSNIKKKEDICNHLKQLEDTKENQNLVERFK